jgi:hypothetical protein
MSQCALVEWDVGSDEDAKGVEDGSSDDGGWGVEVSQMGASGTGEVDNAGVAFDPKLEDQGNTSDRVAKDRTARRKGRETRRDEIGCRVLKVRHPCGDERRGSEVLEASCCEGIGGELRLEVGPHRLHVSASLEEPIEIAEVAVDEQG